MHFTKDTNVYCTVPTYIRDITAHILTTVFRTSKNPREDIYDLLNTCDKLDFFYSFHELFVNQLRAV